MIRTKVLCDSFALQRSLLQHLPELLPVMEIDVLLAICLGESKPRVILVELESGCFPHRNILILPIRSPWKFSELAALKAVEFCNLATCKYQSKDESFLSKRNTKNNQSFHVYVIQALTSSISGKAFAVVFPISVAASAAFRFKAAGSLKRTKQNNKYKYVLGIILSTTFKKSVLLEVLQLSWA